MTLNNALSFRYNRPEFFAEIIEVAADSKLTDQEKKCLNEALLLIEKSLKKDLIVVDDRISIFFIESDTLIIRVDDSPNILAWYNQIVCFHINRLRKGKYTDLELMTIMLEEFCHCFYRIVDESLVRDKVTEIIQLRFPQLTRQEIYQNFADPQPLCND